ncbi:DNA helicase IV [Amycolatopsis arida]|uniref:DNA helicase IV n=1 Tax=Amycolatopsis arida TaxID=587909 RepID=A0A1I5Z1D8_9PSEU|nr:ATP-binding domain-containing protein [Amycolatopsis arida]TDX90039.1 DNA helicase IV [Amycolatopsis arida]SFQ50242.1 DNA helicase IV [Amycolatopsis arida]
MSLSRNSREPDTTTEIVHEQSYLDLLYRKLDTEREVTARRRDEALRGQAETPQAAAERDASATMYGERLAQLNSVEQGLCFGRLDTQDGQTHYIGRLGLFDEDADYDPLLLDWRAPAARPFYLATAASPDGVRRRRHLRTLSRTVVGLDDEILDLTAPDQGHDLGLAGEAALLAALERRRTGEMSDIVATIQAEQDRVIRADLGGVLVVQGGPGTGKTAVALHRAAYLLYTHRRQLSSRGVLVVGPTRTFLRYIGQVLPSLGETGVLLATMGTLFPGVTADGTDSPEAAEVKGRAVMVDVLAAAVRDRQVMPDAGAPLEIGVEGETLRLDRDTCARARERARRTLRPHNLARRVFVDQVLDALTAQSVARTESDVFDGLPEIPLSANESPDGEVLDARDHAAIRAELAADPAVRAALDELWPVLTPRRVLADLFGSGERLASAAGDLLTESERAALLRSAGGAWTPADVPLLDELAELLGEDDTEARAEQARRQREERAYAEGVLHILEQDDEIIDEEVVRVRDILDAELLAERQQLRGDLTAAQRAARDRTWTFGHVIVDEAQELSAMDWRLLMRRCPSRSMTVVGDVAQTGAVAGTSAWGDVLGPYVGDRWRLRELTVNYRTPAEIMELAGRVLAEANPELRAPTSVRETGTPPWRRGVDPAELPDRIGSIVDDELAAADGGTVAVLCPAALRPALSSAVHTTATTSGSPDRVSVLTVNQAKGLEFDAVVVVAPEEIVAASPRGYNDLYVALTRATQRLGLVHTGPPLPALSGAAELPGEPVR